MTHKQALEDVVDSQVAQIRELQAQLASTVARAERAEGERDEARAAIDSERKRGVTAHSALADAFSQLVNISLQTDLGGEVDDYAEVTASVKRVVAERDELREQLRVDGENTDGWIRQALEAQRWAKAWKYAAKIARSARRKWKKAYEEDFGEVLAQVSMRKTVEAERDAASAALRRVMEALSDMVARHCTMRDGTLDSCALSANADAMRILAEAGEIEVTDEYGRRVIGKWKPTALAAESEG